MKILYLILHYKNAEVTERCVDSLLRNTIGCIVIYDNGSNNESGEELEIKYKKEIRVSVVINKTPHGFSRGNNLAFDYIRKHNIPFDFLVVTNNDIVFDDPGFENSILSCYKERKNAVLGPDIRMFSNHEVHQNPLMLSARSRKEINSYIYIIKKKIKYIWIYSIKSCFKDMLKPIRKLKNQSHLLNFDYTLPHEGVCLSGSCLIFTPVYFEHYHSLFWPETQFYHEEEIMYYKLKNDRLLMSYEPSIKVLHDHSISTRDSFKSTRERLLFQYNNNLLGCIVLLNFVSELGCLSEASNEKE